MCSALLKCLPMQNGKGSVSVGECSEEILIGVAGNMDRVRDEEGRLLLDEDHEQNSMLLIWGSDINVIYTWIVYSLRIRAQLNNNCLYKKGS